MYVTKKRVIQLFENPIPLKSALGGRMQLANYCVAYEETQSNGVSDFRVFGFYFT